MKFSFKIQQYQTDAVDAVVRVFQGQPYHAGVSYLRDIGTSQGMSGQLSLLAPEDNEGQTELQDLMNDSGFKNEVIRLTDEQILDNVRTLQDESGIHQSAGLVAPMGRCSLDIEMETGTGKTYVYIKTMFEMNKRYGWSKFIVVVPSIAIREGVKKSFEITADHFMECYGKKARFFIYNSSNLDQLDSFSGNAGINVMIINTQAFAASMNEDKNVEGRRGNAAARIIYTKRDEFGSRRPIDVIAANRPILILDEPQKMGKEDSVTQKALKRFNPLFTLNYSATHAKQHNLIYVLDALDAYNKRLVKRIEVKGFEVKNLRGTDKYLYLENILVSPKRPPQARLELEVARKNGTKREFKKLNVGDNLYYLSGEMEQYKGFVVSEIDPFTGILTFTNGDELRKGDVAGDVSESDMRRVQIRETIISHFEKEQELFHLGIKTLSLFFIDEVAKYRQYDEDGKELLGEYGRIFEQEYISVMNEHRTLFDPAYMAYLDAVAVHDVHKGYFSIDKKGHMANSSVKRGTDLSDDISAYDLILKNKERLLSFEEPTRFIFSHSALREGWDNPNVFQICTLKHSDSTTQKRQEVGRGLRLCVNQSGNRMDGEALGSRVQDINVLTVIASESYAGFVDSLQKQTEAVLYDRPRKADIEYFSGRSFKLDGRSFKVDERQARAIYQYLVRNNYVDEDDHVTRKYREDAKAGHLASLPETLKPIGEGVHALVQAIYDDSLLKAMFEDGNKPKVLENPLNDRFQREEFQKLWKTINHKYAYTVDFDSTELIQKAISHIDSELYVSRLQYTVTYAGQKDKLNAGMVREGASFYDAKSKTMTMNNTHTGQVPYDLLGKIAEGTVLTRRTVAAILQGIRPDIFAMYQSNPEEFMMKAVRLIKEQKAAMIVEHITYDTIGGGYDSSIFTAEKHNLTMNKAYPAKKAIQEYVFTDGIAEKSVERQFAESLDSADEVFIYAKLPKGFYIPTPVGHYSPDWAIVFHEGKVRHIYFVAETKGTMKSLELRPIEKAKIDCARKLFAKLSDGLVTYDHVDSYQELLNKVMQ